MGWLNFCGSVAPTDGVEEVISNDLREMSHTATATCEPAWDVVSDTNLGDTFSKSLFRTVSIWANIPTAGYFGGV